MVHLVVPGQKGLWHRVRLLEGVRLGQLSSCGEFGLEKGRSHSPVQKDQPVSAGGFGSDLYIASTTSCDGVHYWAFALYVPVGRYYMHGGGGRSAATCTSPPNDAL